MNQPATTELNKEDCEAIIRNLDVTLAILDKNIGRRSLADIKIRSMIAVLRQEIAEVARAEGTIPPFAPGPSSSRLALAQR